MATRISCSNGHVLGIGPEHAGKKIKCPKCQEVMQVPGAGAVQAPRGSSATPPPRSRPDDDAIEAPRSRKPRYDDEEDDRPRSRRGRDDEDDDDRPRRSRDRDDDPPPRRGRDRDEEDDDRPRSRKSRDDAWDDDEPPRKKKDFNDEDDDSPRSRRDRDDDEWDDEPKSKKAERKQQRQAARVGLLLHAIRYFLESGSFGFCVLGGLLGLISFMATPIGIAQVGGILLLIGFIGIFIASPILGLVGNIFCLRMPAKANGFGLAMTGLILNATVLGLFVAVFLAVGVAAMSLVGGGAPNAGGAETSLALGLIMMLLMFGAYVAAYIVYMLTLKNVARFVKDKYRAAESLTIMIVFLAVLFGGFILLIIVGLVLPKLSISSIVIQNLLSLAWYGALGGILLRVAFLTQGVKDEI